jgi:membrane-associated phospholipid phosphatase
LSEGQGVESPSLEWKTEWRSFGVVDWMVAGTAGAAALVALGIGPRDDGWQGGILFDEDARLVLRAPTESGRHLARDISDILITINASYGLVIDSLLVAAFVHDAPEVAWQLTLINMQAMAITVAIQTASTAIASRERPYGRTCGDELSEDTRMCDSQNRFQSFFSGHTSMTFVTAALTCSHHVHLPLYGGGLADVVPCITGLAFAATAGLLRIVGDQHYASDVLFGATLGTLVGFLVPWFHYNLGPDRAGEPTATGARRSTVRWSIVPTGPGLAAVGTF